MKRIKGFNDSLDTVYENTKITIRNENLYETEEASLELSPEMHLCHDSLSTLELDSYLDSNDLVSSQRNNLEDYQEIKSDAKHVHSF